MSEGVREGWNTTRDEGEWLRQTDKGFCIVRNAGPYVRCYTGTGGTPKDFAAVDLEDAFHLGNVFLEGLELAEVGEIMLFTKLLDGGYPLRCSCGNIWRFVPGDNMGRIWCPSCGRGAEYGVSCTIEEYKNSRKD
jgi:hypothetical protein